MSSACSRDDTAKERSPSCLPCFPVFLSGEVKGVKNKVHVQREKKGPSISCRSHGNRGRRVGRGKIAQPLCSAHPAVRALSLRPATRSQRRELESLALGGTKGGASAHAHSESWSRRGGRQEATTWLGGGEVSVSPSGGAFVLSMRLQALWGFGCSGSQRRAARLPPGAHPERG